MAPNVIRGIGALLVTVCCGSLSAQEASRRAELQAFQDSVARIADTAALSKLQTVSPDPAQALLLQGMILLRRGELGATRNPFDDAIRRFESALDRDDRAPYAWYVLGLCRLSLWGRGYVVKETKYQSAGVSYRRAAMDAFSGALRIEPGFSPASDALGGLVVSMGHRLLEQEFRAPLWSAAQAPGPSPSVLLALFRLDFGHGDYDASLADLDRYLAVGGDSSVAALERARGEYASGRLEHSSTLYWEGTARMTPAGRAEYRADLAWIAADWELAEFDTVQAERLRPWLERFWGERDVLALRKQGERLQEHLRRWVFVHQKFLVHRPDDAPKHAEGQPESEDLFKQYDEDVSLVMTNLSLGAGGFATYKRTQWEVDDRGVIYLRHGEPSAKAVNPSGPPNESWAYDLPQGRRIFHFLGSRALGTSAATTLTAALPPEVGMLDSRSGLDPSYGAMAADLQRRIALARGERLALELKGGAGAVLARMNRAAAARTGAAASVEAASLPGAEWRSPASALRPETVYREIERGRSAIASAVTTDGYPQRFKRDLEAIVQVYGAGMKPGQAPRVLTVFAIPGKNMVPTTRSDGGSGVLYPVRLRVIAMNRERSIVRTTDTTRVFLTKGPLGQRDHIMGILEVPVPEGTYEVRVLVAVPGDEAATGVARDSIMAGAPAHELALSNPVLGRKDAGMHWRYGDESVALNPLNAWPVRTDADLFYEIGGLDPGSRYSVALAVNGAGDGPADKPRVQSTFSFTAETAVLAVTRSLGLSNLKPGAYLLTVTVQHASSGELRRRQVELNIYGQ